MQKITINITGSGECVWFRQIHALLCLQTHAGTECQLYIYVVLPENHKAIQSFANRAQPPSHKLSSHVTDMVLLVGDLLSVEGDVRCIAGSQLF